MQKLPFSNIFGYFFKIAISAKNAQKMVLRVTSSSRLKMAEMQAVPSIRLIVLFKRLHL